MTGFLVRVEIDGLMKSIDIDELTDQELDRFVLAQMDQNEDGWNWAQALARWIRDNVKRDSGDRVIVRSEEIARSLDQKGDDDGG